MMEDKDIKEYHKMVEKLEKKETYQPLPDGLIIQKSSIEGQGLFTTKFIDKNVKLGLSHVIVGDKIIRTPLGGFINHSEDPNCTKVKEGHKYYLKTIKDITGGEELTVKYSFYSINKK